MSQASSPTRVVDVRSDTLTLPTSDMRRAIADAELGDDVFGEDPTVNRLQERVASLLGKEAGLLVPTGTMANLIAVLCHCNKRGCEVIVGDKSHIHLYEQGGISQLGGVHPKTLRNEADGTFSIAEVRNAVRSDDPHFPITSLVCIENTHNMAGGKVLPMKWIDQLGDACKELNLPIHMDGARLLNAVVALKEIPSRVVRDCSSVSVCLSKGLGAPVGSILVGPKEFIERARRMRKALGGGMRQAGIIAAAGIYALDYIYPRLHHDHQHVQIIAKGVSECGSPAVSCDVMGAHTNILMLKCDPQYLTPVQLCDRMKNVTSDELNVIGENVKVRMLDVNPTTVRLVTHVNITTQDVNLLLAKMLFVIKEFNNKE